MEHIIGDRILENIFCLKIDNFHPIGPDLVLFGPSQIRAILII